MAKDMQVIWVKKEQEYFFEGGWKGVSVICPGGQNQSTYGDDVRAGTPGQLSALSP
jgi:hypothetical protein